MDKLKEGLKELLESVGAHNQALLNKTPDRMQQMYQSFLEGACTSPEDMLGDLYPINPGPCDIITIDHLPFCSLCIHHLVPFFGKMHLSFIPSAATLGLGRFPKYISSVSKTLTLQEHLGAKIIEDLFDKLRPKAILLKIVAAHSCLAIKGLHGLEPRMITEHFRGDANLKFQLAQTLHGFK